MCNVKRWLFNRSMLLVPMMLLLALMASTGPAGASHAGVKKKKKAPSTRPIYQESKLPTTEWEGVSAAQDAATHELKQTQKNWKKGDRSISAQELRKTLRWLEQGANPNQRLSAIAIRGKDGGGNTHFTGYYTPMLEVKSKPDATFRYPLYRMPKKWPNGRKLTRRQIDSEKGLANLGLEIAYSASLIDNYFAQSQGSVQLHFVDTGEESTIAYSGKNGHPYTSIGRHLSKRGEIPARKATPKTIRRFLEANPEKAPKILNINDSYTFFRPVGHGPFAASGAKATPLATVAVDPKYIPHGAVLLAEIPRINAQGAVSGHTWRLLVAQDTGGGIKGPGQIDLFMGSGSTAATQAHALNHRGRLWWIRA